MNTTDTRLYLGQMCKSLQDHTNQSQRLDNKSLQDILVFGQHWNKRQTLASKLNSAVY